MLPYVVIASYVRTDGWLIFRLSQCRFVIKWGHIFTIPFRVKFIHLYHYQNANMLDFVKVVGVVTAMISDGHQIDDLL